MKTEAEKFIIINGKEYKLMKIGIPVSDNDIRHESSWYILDLRKQEKGE